ncbi:hypothetical protein WISP_147848 [Willisornis vidua]|uniref:Uncharacterized protein n=1 Tax=Willisornis vidua TaxID=1566151 RepID=A0ABQ9CLD1_9PASS|nr:hypothetical protein WISP_147848 [Willisornis vidua]
MEALNTAQGARDFIYSLHSTERSCLLRELHRFESIAIAQVSSLLYEMIHGSCTYKQCSKHDNKEEKTKGFDLFRSWRMQSLAKFSLKALWSLQLPIVPVPISPVADMTPQAGCDDEKLEVAPPSPGQLRHAAALGNLVSDLAGLGLAGYVEALASRLGLSIPDLTPKQADMWQTRLSAHLKPFNSSTETLAYNEGDTYVSIEKQTLKSGIPLMVAKVEGFQVPDDENPFGAESYVAIQRNLDRLEECLDWSLMESNQGIWQVLPLGRSSPMHCYRLELTSGKALEALVDPKMTMSQQLSLWQG